MVLTTPRPNWAVIKRNRAHRDSAADCVEITRWPLLGRRMSAASRPDRARSKVGDAGKSRRAAQNASTPKLNRAEGRNFAHLVSATGCEVAPSRIPAKSRLIAEHPPSQACGVWPGLGRIPPRLPKFGECANQIVGQVGNRPAPVRKPRLGPRHLPISPVCATFLWVLFPRAIKPQSAAEKYCAP